VITSAETLTARKFDVVTTEKGDAIAPKVKVVFGVTIIKISCSGKTGKILRIDPYKSKASSCLLLRKNHVCLCKFQNIIGICTLN